MLHPLKFFFKLRYYTHYGETVYLSVQSSQEPAADLKMRYLDKDHWGVETTIDTDQNATIAYSYYIQQQDGTIQRQEGLQEIFDLKQLLPFVLVCDVWNDVSIVENVYHTQPFKTVFLADHLNVHEPVRYAEGATHIFCVQAPLLPAHYKICILGSSADLNGWNKHRPLILERQKNHRWQIALNLSKSQFPVKYKYGCLNTHTHLLEEYETGEDRTLLDEVLTQRMVYTHDGYTRFSRFQFKGAGVAIPVFSLRSQHSLGVGQFSDIKYLSQWAASVGIKMIQLLPINDCTISHTWKDSYPYSAISAFALHPLYLDLEMVIQQYLPSPSADLLERIKTVQQTINHLPIVDYDQVIPLKENLTKQLFDDCKIDFFDNPFFKIFYLENQHWLLPYAVFCSLRDQYQTTEYPTWPTHAVYDETAICKLGQLETASHAIKYYYFVQFLLSQQLQNATAFAHQKGVIIKGDLPIGIYRYSVDAWQYPHYFQLDKSAGAPPDDFAVKGQNWGLPTYHWGNMTESGFSWWKNRFIEMGKYFDAFRIDHVLGFFRIWTIQNNVEGIMGHFEKALPVSVYELREKNIVFNYDRFLKPFVTPEILQTRFGKDTETIQSIFFEHPVGRRLLDFKTEFDNQQKIAIYFANQAEGFLSDQVKHHLFDLLSNVIFFEDEQQPATHFHFRIDVFKTTSFQHLDAFTKAQLTLLYNDYFYQRQDHLWEKEGRAKLKPLKASTRMLVCAEDLGMVPPCVPSVLNDLNILSLEVQRMPKISTTHFSNPAQAPYMSVVTPSTHDMSTLRGWWEENPTDTQLFYNTELQMQGPAPAQCEAWVNKAIVVQHLQSPAMWSVFQLQDLLGCSTRLRRENFQEERINVPANPNHNWNYRMHLFLEELLDNNLFNNELKNCIAASGR